MTHDKALIRLSGDLERAHALENPYIKIKRLLNIAQQFEALKIRPKSEEVYDQVLEIIPSMPDGHEKINILQKLGFLQEAIQMTRQCLNGVRKATTLIDISHLIEQPEQLVSLWQEAIAVAREIVDVHKRDQSLAYVVTSVPKNISFPRQARVEIPLEQATALHNQAVQIAAQSIQGLECREDTLYDLALSAYSVDQQVQILNQNSVIFSHHSLREDRRQHYASVSKNFEELLLSNFQKQKLAKEVYRFIYLPSFDTSLIIRVWSTKSSHPYLYLTVKLGVEGWGEDSWMLTEESSLSLLTAIEKNQFWEAVTWDLSVGCDGSFWVFEGWRDGHYKILDSWSPVDGPAYRLGTSFFNLLPQKLLETIKVY